VNGYALSICFWLLALTQLEALLQPRQAAGQNFPFRPLPANEDPAAALQSMFDRMAENAGPFGAMFGRLTPEQLERLDVIDVSVAEEAQYGRKVLDTFVSTMRQQNITITHRFPESHYIRKLVATLRSHMQHSNRYPRVRIYLIDRDGEDAYSIPGGTLLITRGLLDRVRSEAALVGVLAHELSHLDRGHQLLPLKQSKLSKQPLNFGDGMMLVSLVARPFRPEQETEADADATKWMMAAKYQPLELVRLLDRWDRRQDAQMPWQNFVPGFVKSHPDAGIRAQAVAELADKLKANHPQATYIGRENLRRRVPRSERAFP
jgi:predicted Zn-dependent protease